MNEEEQQTLLKIKPNLINALLPLFMKNIIIGIIIATTLFLAHTITDLIWTINVPFNLTTFVIITVISSVLPLTFNIIKLLFTKYMIYHNRATKEFKFIIIKRQTAMFKRVTNIHLEANLWDRLCNSGHITLNTADDDEEDLRLDFINNPEEIEQQIYLFIENNKQKEQ